MKAALPTRLRRRQLTAWSTLVGRLLAAAGLLLAAVLAAASHRGLISLAFLTATSLVAIAVARAHQATRHAAAASRLHGAVEDALSVLASRGWHLKHGVRWPEGPGDGHLAMTPAGDLAFAVKDCTASIEDFDLAQTQEFATALCRTGRPYIPICVGTASHAQSFAERGVICCPPELLVAELLDAERAFATSLLDEAAHIRLLYNESSAPTQPTMDGGVAPCLDA
jgi:hypothetical protein